MTKAKIIVIWVIGIMFIATGISKLFGLDPMSAELFTRAKYPSILFYAVALFELLGGLMVLRVKSRQIGSALLCLIMLGAIATHLYLRDNLAHCIVPLLIILFCGSFINFRRKK